MSQISSYKVLSQADLRDESENEQISLPETSDEQTSSQDSLDLVLLKIGSKRKLRKKRRRLKMGMSSFDGSESYEVSKYDLKQMKFNRSIPVFVQFFVPRELLFRSR